MNNKLNSSPQCHPVAKKTNIAMLVWCINRNVTCRTHEEILLPPPSALVRPPVLHTVFPKATGSAGGDPEESKRKL